MSHTDINTKWQCIMIWRFQPPNYNNAQLRAFWRFLLTPWRINGRNLQPSPIQKGKWSEPNLHEDMFQPLIFKGVIMFELWFSNFILLFSSKNHWTLQKRGAGLCITQGSFGSPVPSSFEIPWFLGLRERVFSWGKFVEPGTRSRSRLSSEKTHVQRPGGSWVRSFGECRGSLGEGWGDGVGWDGSRFFLGLPPGLCHSFVKVSFCWSLVTKRWRPIPKLPSTFAFWQPVIKSRCGVPGCGTAEAAMTKSWRTWMVHRDLGGVNSNIFYFHPEPWGNDPFWRIFFQRGWNHQLPTDRGYNLKPLLPIYFRPFVGGSNCILWLVDQPTLWFQRFCIFDPGDDPIWWYDIFQMGWFNHQLG